MNFEQAFKKLKTVLPKEAIDLLPEGKVNSEKDLESITNLHLQNKSTNHPRVQMMWKIRSQHAEWMKKVYELVTTNDHYWFGLYYNDKKSYAYYFTENEMIISPESEYKIEERN